MEILYKEVKDVLADFGYDIPVIAAGEVCTRADIEKNLEIGYDGVQIGTFFIATEEAGMDRKSKEVFVNATPEDVVSNKKPGWSTC